MNKTNGNPVQNNETQVTPTGHKILLVLLPFWSPLIQPMGIASLKSFLMDNGYNVKTVDGNSKSQLRELYHSYFSVLAKYIPRNKRGNFYSVGQDVLRNHQMAHYNRTDESAYNELVKDLVYKTFYSDVPPSMVDELNSIMEEFFTLLEDFYLDLLAKETPDIVGFSVYNGTLPATYCALKLTRKHYPHIKTLAGGGVFADQLAPGSPNMDFFLEKTSDCLDYIFNGEGELLLLKWLKGQLPPQQKIYTLADIDWQTLDIKTASMPNFDDFDMDHYPNYGSSTSRSCPFQCSFCSETVQWGKYRKKSGKQIVEELTGIYRQTRDQLFFMSDSLLNPVVTDLSRRLLQEETSIYWDGYLRAHRDACNTENTMLWRRGGFYRARLGLESGSQRVLDLMNKRITLKEIRETVAALAHAGIKTTTYWLLGFPGETEEDFQATLDFVEEMKDDIYEADCNPFWYFLSGQVNADEWRKKDTPKLLYPADARDMLLLQTWHLNNHPTREERYLRVNRFREHCARLRIPNPYSLMESNLADQRWKQLHHNAVPALLEFESNTVKIGESREIKELTIASQKNQFDGDWDF